MISLLFLSHSCATTAIFNSVVPQYQAPVPGVRGQHHDTSMISLLFLLSICTCIPGPSNSRVDTNMSTSLPTIYPSYLYLNSQENKDIMFTCKVKSVEKTVILWSFRNRTIQSNY